MLLICCFLGMAAKIEQYQSDGSNSLGNQMTAISQGNSWEGFSFRLVAENRWIFSVQFLHATFFNVPNKRAHAYFLRKYHTYLFLEKNV